MGGVVHLSDQVEDLDFLCRSGREGLGIRCLLDGDFQGALMGCLDYPKGYWDFQRGLMEGFQSHP